VQFLTQSSEAIAFTEQLLSVIRQERHIATRVLIATQEPTLSPKLLELCNVSIVHRFSSPAWLETLKAHLAGLGSIKNSKSASEELFRNIVSLRTGQALLFSPEAMLDVAKTESDLLPSRQKIRELKDSFIQIRIRQRVTADGGRSILASDSIPEDESHNIQSELRSSPEGSSLEGKASEKSSPGDNRVEESGSSESASIGSSFGDSDPRGGADVSGGKHNGSNSGTGGLALRPKLQTKSQKLKAANSQAPAASAPTLAGYTAPRVPKGWGAVFSDRFKKW
jgi:hypothetical protein